jgi:hypothetical protein
VAIFIDGEWYMNIGYTTNFKDRIRSINREYKIHMDNFYDAKKDIINRPKKSYLDRLVSQKTQLQVYFTLNFF